MSPLFPLIPTQLSPHVLLNKLIVPPISTHTNSIISPCPFKQVDCPPSISPQSLLYSSPTLCYLYNKMTTLQCFSGTIIFCLDSFDALQALFTKCSFKVVRCLSVLEPVGCMMLKGLTDNGLLFLEVLFLLNWYYTCVGY